jgi:hypothetical protein
VKCGDYPIVFPARPSVFDNDEFFTRRNLKTSQRNKFAIAFFDKNVALTWRTTGPLADNDSAKRREIVRVKGSCASEASYWNLPQL